MGDEEVKCLMVDYGYTRDEAAALLLKLDEDAVGRGFEEVLNFIENYKGNARAAAERADSIKRAKEYADDVRKSAELRDKDMKRILDKINANREDVERKNAIESQTIVGSAKASNTDAVRVRAVLSGRKEHSLGFDVSSTVSDLYTAISKLVEKPNFYVSRYDSADIIENSSKTIAEAFGAKNVMIDVRYK